MLLRIARPKAAALALTFVTLTSVSILSAQEPKVLAPHKPVMPFAPKPWIPHKPSVPRSIIGGLWRVDANFKSTIYLKNYVEISPITVTPVLYLGNGKSYTLPDVTLEPAGTATVNINDALREQGIAPWATLSGYVEIKYQWPWDALCVMVRDVDVVHSLIFTYFLRSFPATLTADAANATTESHYAEGMWWKHESDVSGFLALSNPTAKPVQAQIQISDDQSNVLGEHTITVSPHGTKLWDIPELQSAKSSEGGIRVTYSGPEFSVFVTGGLEDQTLGYSANIPFTSSPPTALDSKPLSYSELGLMTGAADPMMSFPARTTFTPYSLVHNVSNWPISVTPSLYWMQGAAPRSFRAKAFTLLPHQTISLDVASLLLQSGLKDFNGSFNLILDALCHSDERYTWSVDGVSVNIYPRAANSDPSYLLGLRIGHIMLDKVPDPDQALTPLSKIFPGQQVGYFGGGGDNSYAEPWTQSFDSLTVRQFIDRVSEHMGQQTSWVWEGGRGERMFTFIKGGFHTSNSRPR